MRSNRPSPSLIMLCVALGLSVSACGKKDSKTQATQVAATVGDEEISVHQVNQVLQQAVLSNQSPEVLAQKRREIVDKLIDQELVVGQAKEAKLHRSPEVVQQLEAARREILARAYMQQVGRGVPKPSTQELKQYYADNPALFSRRRIYDVQEVAVPAGSNVDQQLRQFASGDQSIEQATAWLQAREVKFNSGGASRAAEQIPLDLLRVLDGLKDGQSTVVSNERGTTLLRLASSQLMPISEELALPRIEQYLVNKRTTETVNTQLKSLRAETPIEYLGEFASVASSPATSAATPANNQATAAPDASAKPLTTVEKGMVGLK